MDKMSVHVSDISRVIFLRTLYWDWGRQVAVDFFSSRGGAGDYIRSLLSIEKKVYGYIRKIFKYMNNRGMYPNSQDNQTLNELARYIVANFPINHLLAILNKELHYQEIINLACTLRKDGYWDVKTEENSSISP